MVAFNELECVVARVTLELDICKTAQSDCLEEGPPQLGNDRIPLLDVIATHPKIRRELAQLSLYKAEQRAAVVVDICDEREKLIIIPRDDLRHHHFEAEFEQVSKRVVELSTILRDECLLTKAKVTDEPMCMKRL